MSNIHIVRQHSENASETSIWRELTASNHEIHHFSSWAQTCPAVDLRICYIGFPELLRKSSLVCLLCSLAISLQTNGSILSTWQKKTPVAINSFALSWPAFSLVALLLFELQLVKDSRRALWVIAQSTMCVSTAKMLLKRQFGVSWRPLIMKFFISHNCVHARNLDLLQSLSYWFSWVSRCNPLKHNNIF